MTIKRHKYIIVSIISCLFIARVTCINISASQTQNTIEDYKIDQFIDTLPSEYKNYLPESNPDEAVTEYAKKIEFHNLITFCCSVISNLVKPTTKILFSLISIIILSSLINNTKNALSQNTFEKATEFITHLCITLFIYEIISSLLQEVNIFMSCINSIINSFIPVTFGILMTCGNTSSAITSSASFTLILTIINNIYNIALIPIVNICFGLTLAGSCGETNGLSQIIKIAKSIFTFILTASVTLLSIFLIFKTNISTTFDSASIRTIKFAGSFVPIVGSALGESVRGIMAGINIIKSSVGFIGIFIILVITVPTITSIVLYKLCLSIGAAIANILGCDKESKLLNEFCGIANLALSTVICSSLILLLELTAFTMISPALGGS